MGDQVNGRPQDGTPAAGAGGTDDVEPRDASSHPGTPWQSPGAAPGASPRAGSPWQSPAQHQVPANPYAAQPDDGVPSNPWSRHPGASSGPDLPINPDAAPAYGGQQSPPDGAQLPGQGWGTGYPPGVPGQYGGPYGGPAFPPAPQYQAPPKPGVIPLRPLGLGEILDGAFQACRKNPLATFGTAILLQAVVALVTVLLLGNALSSFGVFEQANPTPDSVIGAFASFGVFASVAGVVSAVALLVLQGILVIPIARAVINQNTSFGQAWRLARRRLLPLFGFGLLSFAAGLAGLVLLVGISALAIAGLAEYSAFVIVPLVIAALVAMVWITIKLVVAPATLMLEGTGPWTSIKRSWQLTRGNWWRTFGIVLLTSIIVSIIASVIATPLTFAVGLIFGFSSSASATPDALDSLPIIAGTQAITALFTAIGYAFQAGVTSLLYVDLRIRREGFDVVLMREHEQARTGRTDVLPGGTASFGHQPGGPA